MSQHIIDNQTSPHFFRIGFDPGLNTFFAQVVDRELHRIAEEAGERVDEAIRNNRDYSPEDARAADAETIILWVGTTPDEIQTVEALGEALKNYVELDSGLKATLLEDMKRTAHPPTALQSMMHRLITDASKTQNRSDK